jgi:transcriptional regulatory protein RtcR
MATLVPGGRITREGVNEEVERLRAAWARSGPKKQEAAGDLVVEVLGEERAEALDRFDRAQLAEVLAVCRQARTLSDAGRALFARSRAQKKSVNDADRLRKYLARFELGWAEVTGQRFTETP